MNTPRPKYFCPQCRTGYTVDQNYCGRCGTDMKHVSGLAYAALREVDPGETSDTVEAGRPPPGHTREHEAWTPPRVPDRRTGGRDPWLGRVVDGRYKVIEAIGRGGMGVVYKVEHQRMGKIAAMKVLHGDLANDAEVIGRFRREAEAVSRLTHPNTVQVFDFGAAEGALYLIMEYVRGLDLGTLVKRDGPLPFERAAPLLGQICSALEEAHGLGVVHRDLKPENVLVTRTHSGRDFVKVLDFGLAKLTEREESSEVTDRGSIVGTPYYMSPEQIRGEDLVDARSDIYSLGALMYKIITGEPAYSAKSPVGVLTKHLTAQLVPPSQRAPELDIDPLVDAIVIKAMSKPREDRYESTSAMLGDLEQAFLELVGASPSSGLAGLSSFASSGGGSSSSRPRRRSASLVDDEVDYGMDSQVRLQREDIGHYERRLRRLRLVRTVLVPLVLAALGGVAAYWFLVRTEPPRTHEVEPNDGVDSATRIALDSDVTGYIGKRVTARDPDIDFFRVVEAPAPNAAVTISITGVPNMDLELRLYDPTGKLLLVQNEAGIGLGETIRGFRVSKPVVVAVTQRKDNPAALPVENVSDAYTLRVALRAVTAGIETEPNETLSDAQPLALGAPITGYLDRREDADTYRFEGTAGTYGVHIGGAGSVPLVWRVDSGAARTEREARVALQPGSLITLERSDKKLDPGFALPGADEPYALELRR
ncbi:MAG TPA: protein kinase [Kofleriaceae bacterium]|nr:protein kinase [Kofleriaceae bacterium]